MNQSKKTEEMHLLACKSLLKFIGDMDVEELTFQHIRDWKESLEKSRSQNTVRGYVIKVRVVIDYARKRGFKVIDPDTIGVPKRKETTVDFITEMEVNKLIEACFISRRGSLEAARYRNRAIISLLYASGIRVSELCRLDRADLRIDRTFTVIGKGDKARLCFFDTRTQFYIDEYLQRFRDDNSPALFTSEKSGKRISVASIQEMFIVARKNAGFTKPIHPHTLRHSFATNLLRNNTNLIYVRDFLGHSSVQTTEMYTHVVNEDLRRIYNEKHTT